MKDNFCYGCKHLITKKDGAGFVTYGCDLKPGIVTGESDYLIGTDDPEACERKE